VPVAHADEADVTHHGHRDDGAASGAHLQVRASVDGTVVHCVALRINHADEGLDIDRPNAHRLDLRQHDRPHSAEDLSHDKSGGVIAAFRVAWLEVAISLSHLILLTEPLVETTYPDAYPRRGSPTCRPVSARQE